MFHNNNVLNNDHINAALVSRRLGNYYLTRRVKPFFFIIINYFVCYRILILTILIYIHFNLNLLNSSLCQQVLLVICT